MKHDKLSMAVAIYVFLMVGIATPGMATADPADDVVIALHYDRYYAQVADVAVAEAVDELRRGGMSGAALDQARAKLNAQVPDYQSAFLGQIAGAYRSRFTADELAQLTAFYRSPLGTKTIETQSTIRDGVADATTKLGFFFGHAAAGLTK